MVRRFAIGRGALRSGLVVVALAVAWVAGAPGAARADTGWFIRYGVTYPPVYVGGPYADYGQCEKIRQAYSYDYRYICEVRTY